MKLDDTTFLPCALCGATDPVFLYRPVRSPGPIVRCANCGLVYVGRLEDTHALIISGPVTSDCPPTILCSDKMQDLDGCWEMEPIAEKESELPVVRLNAQQMLKELSRLVPRPGRILDLGCASGFFLAEAAALGWEAYGLEPLAGHAVYARAKFHLNITTDVLHDDTFPPDFFDAITAFQVFEHLPYPVQDLLRLVRCLKANGAILIEVPRIDHWTVKLLESRHRHFVQDHLFFFSVETLSAMATQCGLKLLRTFFPVRRMTIRHIIRCLCRILELNQVPVPSPLGDVVVPVYLRDVIAIVAQKPAD